MTRPSDDVLDIVRRAMARLVGWGVPVVFVEGWEDRGRPYRFVPRGLVIHHSATKRYDYDYPSLAIVRDGRPDLPGPLSQFGLARHTGTVVVIAGGYANHAGEGGWADLTGNSTVWGVEGENDGIGEQWSPVARHNYVLLALALAIETPFDAGLVCRHGEWSPYKIDPTGIDGDEFRAQVAAGNVPEEDIMAAVSQEAFDHLVRVVERIERVVVGAPAPGEGPDDIDDLRARLERVEGKVDAVAQAVSDTGASGASGQVTVHGTLTVGAA